MSKKPTKSHRSRKGKKDQWAKLKNFSTIRLAWRFYTLLLLWILGAEFFVEAHALFGIDGTPFFYAWFGFFTAAALTLSGSILGMFLKRPREYYQHKE